MAFCDALCIVFIVLKLVGVIAWSWWWFLIPIIFAVVINIVAIMFVIMFNKLEY